ncbi:MULTISPECIES: CRISPR system precrRNA processing endoribonuclease RAMP protein Cas6 [unclassified Bradyrhizobium]|uniref:CRISPR system precrRNA processing endoribonuclease RAMP protein Cas6 n=1 Tax=unclassified Bradyrhizobium TaxID=2631580 RepID=UPI0028E80764|nr:MULTISPECIES: CRISPR system precrRNA processing endoribonuclease RAMP protein Cas6 [unclassified Bradyrhizobium]
MPANRGSLWRGVLGSALKRLDEGILPGISTGHVAPGSLYDTFFASRAAARDGSDMPGDSAPRPYVVDAPPAGGVQSLARGTVETIGLTLIGRPASAVEAVLAAFDFAARRGLGPRQGADRLRGHAYLCQAKAVWRNAQDDAVVFDPAQGFRPVAAEVPVVPPCPPRVRVILATPLRLVRSGIGVGPREFTPALLIGGLIQRVTALSSLYGDIRLVPDHAVLKPLVSRLIAREAEFVFADQFRWSGNHHQEIAAGGIVGSFTLDLDGAEALFPYLWLAQWLHAGKGVVSGLGAIRLRPV